mgnify:CR=1 FL=1
MSRIDAAHGSTSFNLDAAEARRRLTEAEQALAAAAAQRAEAVARLEALERSGHAGDRFEGAVGAPGAGRRDAPNADDEFQQTALAEKLRGGKVYRALEERLPPCLPIDGARLESCIEQLSAKGLTPSERLFLLDLQDSGRLSTDASARIEQVMIDHPMNPYLTRDSEPYQAALQDNSKLISQNFDNAGHRTWLGRDTSAEEVAACDLRNQIFDTVRASLGRPGGGMTPGLGDGQAEARYKSRQWYDLAEKRLAECGLEELMTEPPGYLAARGAPPPPMEREFVVEDRSLGVTYAINESNLALKTASMRAAGRDPSTLLKLTPLSPGETLYEALRRGDLESQFEADRRRARIGV